MKCDQHPQSNNHPQQGVANHRQMQQNHDHKLSLGKAHYLINKI